MNRQEVEEVIDSVSHQFPALNESMQQRLAVSFAENDDVELFSFEVSPDLQSDLCDFFRRTEYFFVAVFEGSFAPGNGRGTLRRKNFVRPTPATCFHATPATNQTSIEHSGLLPGIKLGKRPRYNSFADSLYYIYASLTEADAKQWCDIFAEHEFLIYPVKIGERGIRLFADPCSLDDKGNVSGYIIDADHIPFGALGNPQQRK